MNMFNYDPRHPNKYERLKEYYLQIFEKDKQSKEEWLQNNTVESSPYYPVLQTELKQLDRLIKSDLSEDIIDWTLKDHIYLALKQNLETYYKVYYSYKMYDISTIDDIDERRKEANKILCEMLIKLNAKSIVDEYNNLQDLL